MTNTIRWATLKNTKQTQESYGDRCYHEVEIATDLPEGAERNNRLDKAIRARFPFNPTFCTNQVSNVRSTGNTCTFEMYHSIGD